jgi:hypothetical protein
MIHVEDILRAYFETITVIFAFVRIDFGKVHFQVLDNPPQGRIALRPYDCVYVITDVIVILRADTQVRPYKNAFSTASHIRVFCGRSGNSAARGTKKGFPYLPSSSLCVRCGKLPRTGINFEPAFRSIVPPEQ